jgi:bifunctional DNase/RNase
MLRKVNIAGLTMDPASNTPIIILKTEDDEQAVPIWIGLLEATSIASALQKIKYERPMTHDLFKSFAETQNISIERVEVCDLRDNTFFARIHFVAEGGQSFDMDARPSDAIALALRFAAPIFVEESVIQHSKTHDADVEVADTSEEGKKWADYLEKLSSEDFGKYKV